MLGEFNTHMNNKGKENRETSNNNGRTISKIGSKGATGT